MRVFSQINKCQQDKKKTTTTTENKTKQNKKGGGLRFKGATSRITQLEKAGKFFKFVIRNPS